MPLPTPIVVDPNEKILDQVKLVYFTAEPRSVDAFGNCLFRWEVVGPNGFFVTFGGAEVARIGTQTIQPGVTSAYLLTAKAGNDTKILGEITIDVNTSACTLVDIDASNLKFEVLRTLVPQVLAADTSLSVTQPAEMTFSPGEVQVVFHLTKEIDVEGVKAAPNPEIDVTVQCGLEILGSTGVLTAINPVITASISEPWYVKYIPIYGQILAWEENEKENQIPIDFQPVVPGIAQAIAFWAPPPTGFRYQSVSIAGDAANPPLRITACPYSG